MGGPCVELGCAAHALAANNMRLDVLEASFQSAGFEHTRTFFLRLYTSLRLLSGPGALCCCSMAWIRWGGLGGRFCAQGGASSPRPGDLIGRVTPAFDSWQGWGCPLSESPVRPSPADRGICGAPWCPCAALAACVCCYCRVTLPLKGYGMWDNKTTPL